MNLILRSLLYTAGGIASGIGLLYVLILIEPFFERHALIFGGLLCFGLIWALVYTVLHSIESANSDGRSYY